jgi:hypothetical protein
MIGRTGKRRAGLITSQARAMTTGHDLSPSVRLASCAAALKQSWRDAGAGSPQCP